MDDESSACVYERLCPAQHHQGVICPCPGFQSKGRIEAIGRYRHKGTSVAELNRAAKGINDRGTVEGAANA